MRTKQNNGNTAVVVLLSILCFILTLVLGSTLLYAVTLRSYAQNGTASTAIARLSLKDITVTDQNGTKQTAAEYIMDNYVEDNRVTLENIDRILENGSFTDFASTLAGQYSDYLLGKGELPVLQSEDFVQLIEQNADLIYQETGLEFLEPDKQKLQNNLDTIFLTVNPVLEYKLGKAVGGFAIRALFSLWLEIVLGVLLLAILVWMIVVYIRNHKRVGTGLKVYSIAGAIPCLFTLLGACILQLALKHTEWNALSDISGYFTHPVMLHAGIGLLGCILLFAIGLLCNRLTRRTETVESTELPIYDAADFTAQNVADEPKTDAVTEEATAVELPIAETPQRKFCRNCGNPLVNPDAYFCYKCGNQQQKTDQS